jgi:hypothetical protein
MMRARQIIARLEELITKHGDLEVRIYNSVECEFDHVNEIEPRRFLPSQRASDSERKQTFFGIDPYAIGDWDAQLRYSQSSDALWAPKGLRAIEWPHSMRRHGERCKLCVLTADATCATTPCQSSTEDMAHPSGKAVYFVRDVS